MTDKKYYLYILRCNDNSLYTGITPDIKSRVKTHYNKEKGCAKYTRSHGVKSIEAVWKSDNKIIASKLEYRVKRLTKSQKESLINNTLDLSSIIDDKISVEKIKISLNDCIK